MSQVYFSSIQDNDVDGNYFDGQLHQWCLCLMNVINTVDDIWSLQFTHWHALLLVSPTEKELQPRKKDGFSLGKAVERLSNRDWSNTTRNITHTKYHHERLSLKFLVSYSIISTSWWRKHYQCQWSLLLYISMLKRRTFSNWFLSDNLPHLFGHAGRLDD